MEIKWTIFSLAISEFIFLTEPILGFTSEITYEDLENINATCNNLDNCRYDRTADDLEQYNCHCSLFCRTFDTCCIDSKYRTGPQHPPDTRIKCGAVNGHGFRMRHFFMITGCLSNWKGDSSVQDLCNSDGRDTNDPLLSVPVTSTETGITYKNHFCSICNNESSQEVVFWNVALKSLSKEVMSSSVPELKYNSTIGEWTIRNKTQNTVVYLSVVVPEDMKNVVHSCVPGRIVSECASNWTDSNVESYCKSYTALARISNYNGMVVYQNPHCAVCNFEDLEDMICVEYVIHLQRVPSISSDTFFVGLFSLHDKTKKCDGNMVYDSLAKKCRTVYKG